MIESNLNQKIKIKKIKKKNLGLSSFIWTDQFQEFKFLPINSR